jgi:hypothetical protein
MEMPLEEVAGRSAATIAEIFDHYQLKFGGIRLH